MPLTPLLHVTAAYSNAVLVAILPNVSDTAKTLNLPISQPITLEQVAGFNTSPYADNIGGGLWLTNGYLFVINYGYVDTFSSPNNWFRNPNVEDLEKFRGKDNMTTNAAIDFARESFSKLGHKTEDYHLNESPTEFEPPYDGKNIGHIPFCKVGWQNFPTNGGDNLKSYSITFEIDMHHKTLVGMSVMGRTLWHSNITINVKTELQSDYKERYGTNPPINYYVPPS
jgi:hypothetical protein